ncbi:hypothetical protein CK203_022578 [Vitis vinifera]|uniref:Uncharacterized protein n=1 Tax=Vitis vinifera TaxID=29760 RepID=A0A438JER7_VITVI|nr:hypothetical protein CK203_022578 [Vitis vinifera]
MTFDSLPSVDVDGLETPFSKEEILVGLSNLSGDKVLEFHDVGSFERSLNATFIVLVPKKGGRLLQASSKDDPYWGCCKGSKVQVGALLATYLSLLLGAPCKLSKIWKVVEERVQKRLPLWKSQYLSKGKYGQTTPGGTKDVREGHGVGCGRLLEVAGGPQV